ncbi:MAG: TMEM175 family protein, partial [Nitrososphaerales archaeon]
MSKGRLEAFSDGVIAILVTIMVLDLRPPDGSAFTDLRPLVPKLLVYLMSFTFLAIYWNNHHHLMQVVERIDGRVLWANMALLFCLSLTPAATAWLGPHSHATAPAMVYGIVLLGPAVAYFVLARTLLTIHQPDSRLAVALGRDWKGKLSVV